MSKLVLVTSLASILVLYTYAVNLYFFYNNHWRWFVGYVMRELKLKYKTHKNIEKASSHSFRICHSPLSSWRVPRAYKFRKALSVSAARTRSGVRARLDSIHFQIRALDSALPVPARNGSNRNDLFQSIEPSVSHLFLWSPFFSLHDFASSPSIGRPSAKTPPPTPRGRSSSTSRTSDRD